MKKRSVVLLLVLSTIVFADVPYDSVYPAVNTSDKEKIPRFQDFPLDNIHILRLQEASMSLGRNVSELHDQLAQYQQYQTNQISGMQAGIDNLRKEFQTRTNTIQSTIQQIPQPTAPSKTPFIFLLVSNIILFAIVLILLTIIHKKPLPQDHTHPAPPELIEYIRMNRKNSHELRLELLKKGWKPIFIENAMKIARR